MRKPCRDIVFLLLTAFLLGSCTEPILRAIDGPDADTSEDVASDVPAEDTGTTGDTDVGDSGTDADAVDSDTSADAEPDIVADAPVEDAVEDVPGEDTAPDAIEDTTRDAVEDAVEDAIPDAIEDTTPDTVEDTADVPDGDALADADAPLDPCEDRRCDNGVCVPEDDTARCECEPGWAGEFCELNIDECTEFPCLNGGRCTDEIGGYSCDCRYGYLGDDCEVSNACSAALCENGASCVELGLGEVRCECPAGFHGDRCQYRCERGRCAGVITCDPVTGEDRVCERCQFGFDGPLCENDLRSCASDPCSPGVECSDLEGGGVSCGPCPADSEGDGETCAPAVTWFETFGDPNDDWATGAGQNMDIAADGAGNAYVLGTFVRDFGIEGLSFLVNTSGGYLAKFDQEGEFQWVTPFATRDDTTSGIAALRVRVHPETGDVIVGGVGFGNGEVWVNGEYVGASHPQGSLMAAAFSATDGSTRWVSVLDPATHTYGESMGLAADGRVVVAGYTRGLVSGIRSIEDDRFVVVFFDPDTGEIDNGFTFGSGSAANNQIMGVTGVPGGDIVVAGIYSDGTLSIGDEDLPFLDRANAFATRFSPGGTPRWTVAAATPNAEAFQEVRVGPSGAIYISGHHDGGTSFGGTELGFASLGSILARLDAESGEVEWVTGHTPSSNSLFGLRRMAIDDRERIHIATTTTANSTTRFGTNERRVEPAGQEIRMSLIDGETGALLAERVLSIGGFFIHSNNFALVGTNEAVFAGNYFGSGTLFGMPFGVSGRDGYDHYVMRVPLLVPDGE